MRAIVGVGQGSNGLLEVAPEVHPAVFTFLPS